MALRLDTTRDPYGVRIAPDGSETYYDRDRAVYENTEEIRVAQTLRSSTERI